MPSKRIARLNEQLKREIAELVRSGVRDPRVGMVSVTGVQVAPDLGSARVWVRSLGNDAERSDCLEGLQAAAPWLRRALGEILHIRRIPELRFQEDRSLEQAMRIEEILAEVLPAGEEGGDAPSAGPGPADGKPTAAAEGDGGDEGRE